MRCIICSFLLGFAIVASAEPKSIPSAKYEGLTSTSKTYTDEDGEFSIYEYHWVEQGKINSRNHLASQDVSPEVYARRHEVFLEQRTLQELAKFCEGGRISIETIQSNQRDASSKPQNIKYVPGMMKTGGNPRIITTETGKKAIRLH